MPTQALAGVDEVDSYQQLCDFVRIVSEGSPVRHFIVHCRKALLNLNTVRNRTVPPLRRGWAFALRRDFPHLQFSINGQARSQAAFRNCEHSVAPENRERENRGLELEPQLAAVPVSDSLQQASVLTTSW